MRGGASPARTTSEYEPLVEKATCAFAVAQDKFCPTLTSEFLSHSSRESRIENMPVNTTSVSVRDSVVECLGLIVFPSTLCARCPLTTRL